MGSNMDELTAYAAARTLKNATINTKKADDGDGWAVTIKGPQSKEIRSHYAHSEVEARNAAEILREIFHEWDRHEREVLEKLMENYEPEVDADKEEDFTEEEAQKLIDAYDPE